MNDWRIRTTVVIDTETTGTDVGFDRVVEIAALRSDGERFLALLNPGVSIPSAATAVHGISDENVATSPSFADIAVDLAAFVGNALLVAYNARFDRGMVLAEYLRAGLQPPEWCRPSAHWIDPLVWARKRDPFARGAGRFKLATVAARLGVECGTAHRALGDCETTARILQTLAPAMPADLEQMLMRQRVLAAENEADFLRWLEKQQNKEKAV